MLFAKDHERLRFRCGMAETNSVKSIEVRRLKGAAVCGTGHMRMCDSCVKRHVRSQEGGISKTCVTRLVTVSS